MWLIEICCRLGPSASALALSSFRGVFHIDHTHVGVLTLPDTHCWWTCRNVQYRRVAKQVRLRITVRQARKVDRQRFTANLIGSRDQVGVRQPARTVRRVQHPDRRVMTERLPASCRWNLCLRIRQDWSPVGLRTFLGVESAEHYRL